MLTVYGLGQYVIMRVIILSMWFYSTTCRLKQYFDQPYFEGLLRDSRKLLTKNQMI